jgi:uncharacterized protein YcgL (UPF0745 family)
MSDKCAVYRCSKQQEMYLYLRGDLKPDILPPALLQRMGQLTHVMDLELTPQRKLARVDIARVSEKLRDPGYYLQMPPDGHIKGHLYFGD